MKKFMLFGTFCIVICICITSIIIRQQQIKKQPSAQITIGILQTISIQALDRVREGFIQETQETLGGKIQFLIQNAQGSVATAQMIASSFHRNPDVQGILTIGTLATQVMSNIEKQKPIFMSAVSNAQALGIIHPGTNVCGTSDLVDVEKNIQAVLTLLPATKQVALLHNPAEINSSTVAAVMEKVLTSHEVNAQRIGVYSDADIPAAIAHSCRTADVIIVPTDTTIASAIQTVGATALKAKKPLIVCDNELICPGVLMAAGSVDYFQNGIQTAKIAHAVLLNKHLPEALSIINPKCGNIIIHAATAHALGITIPHNFEHQKI